MFTTSQLLRIRPDLKKTIGSARAVSKLEARFESRWDGLPYVAQYRFHPSRRWRLDFAWPEKMVALEIHGGVWSGGRHTRGGGFIADRRKMNAAVAIGWRILEWTPDDLDDAASWEQLKNLLTVKTVQ
jgi:hypothetical protein